MTFVPGAKGASWIVTCGLAGLSLVLGSCGAQSEGDGSGNGSNGNGGPKPGGGLDLPDQLGGGSGGDGTNTPGGVITDPEKGCGVEMFTPDRLPGELLLVLDRSGSMRYSFARESNGPVRSPNRRWDAMTGALDEVIQKTQGEISWGLSMFPRSGRDGSSCDVAEMPAAPVASNAHDVIMSLVDDTEPSGATPTRSAMEKAVAYLKTLTTPNPKSIILATDGGPNCLPGETDNRQPNDGPGAIAAVKAAKDAGFPVYVLGVAIGDELTGILNGMADAGGKARAGDTRYYPANDQAALTAALAEIAGQAGSCTFNLKAAPPNPANVGLKIDNQLIKQDKAHMDGWDYSSNDNRSVTVYGPTCDKLRAAEKKYPVQFIFGCPDQPIL